MAARRTGFKVLVLAALLVLTAGFSAPARAENTLAIGITQFPHTLHPSIDSMAATAYILGFTRRPLTAHDADWTLVCMVCETLPSIENGLATIEPVPTDIGDGSGKGIAVTYRIREDMTWGDGVPVTADDIRFTWEVARHPLTGFAAVESFRRILAVDVIDDRTVRLHQDRVSFDYAAVNDLRILPKHLEQAAFADPATYRQNSLFERDPTNPGLYMGPYRLAGITPGTQVVLTRNAAWQGKAPAFGRITINAVENTAALEANLLSGGLDMIAGELGLAVDQALAFEKRHGDRYQVVYRPSLFYEHMDVQLDNPILADVRVRQALLQAVDRQTVSDRLFGGKLVVANTSVNPLDWVHITDVPTYPFDPEKARSLLTEAGWTPGDDGIRVNAAGERLSITLQTTAGNRSRERVQQVLQSAWKAVGVEAVIRNEPARVLFGETISKRQFTGLALFAWISAPENTPHTTLHCDQIPTEANAWTGQNYTGYCNPRMDRLIDAITVELDRTRRAALWADLQRLYATDLPALPLFFRVEAHVWPLWLKSIRPTGHMTYSSLWVEDWTVDGRP